ncbi:hypothetical protein T492DRAFT_1030068 [Pavlovales sp. CCMP2436]|nr:hypothetical protein T492DRAFT_1030068 [Pavlovales sp. CCMP2436]
MEPTSDLRNPRSSSKSVTYEKCDTPRPPQILGSPGRAPNRSHTKGVTPPDPLRSSESSVELQIGHTRKV